jgi:hypothetical protein
MAIWLRPWRGDATPLSASVVDHSDRPMRLPSALLALASAILHVRAAPPPPSAASFYVPALPGLHGAPAALQLWAGHLPADGAGAPEGPHLYFVLTKARRSADKERVIFWFNGGPGCSSFDGLMMEVGPWRVDGHGGLRFAEGGWEEYAHVVYGADRVCVQVVSLIPPRSRPARGDGLLVHVHGQVRPRAHRRRGPAPPVPRPLLLRVPGAADRGHVPRRRGARSAPMCARAETDWRRAELRGAVHPVLCGRGPELDARRPAPRRRDRERLDRRPPAVSRVPRVRAQARPRQGGHAGARRPLPRVPGG